VYFIVGFIALTWLGFDLVVLITANHDWLGNLELFSFEMIRLTLIS